MVEEYYSTSEAADLLGVTAKTLRTWDKNGAFKPEQLTLTGNRHYSRKQIEERLGQPIEESTDPILAMNKEDLDDLIWLCEVKDTMNWDTLLGDTLKERIEGLISKIYQTSIQMFRLNQTSGANCIICSPETMLLFQCCLQWSDYQEYNSTTKIRYSGVLNSRWKVYETILVEAGTIILCYVNEKNELIEDPKFLSLINSPTL